MTALAADLAAALDPVRFAADAGFDAEDWEANLLRSSSRRVHVCCARQVGKSTTTGIKAVHTAMYRPGSLSVIVSPTQRQSNEMLLAVKGRYRALGNAKPARDSDTELALENGSRILSLPGTDSSTRGFADVKLLVIDEAALVEDEIYYAVLPMVASDGAIWVLSTPAGRRGWFFDLHEDPRNGWEKHRVTVYQSGQYDAERIELMRSSMPAFEFASEYECVFGDTATQLFSTELIDAMVDPAVRPLELP